MFKRSLESGATLVVILCAIFLDGTMVAFSESPPNEQLPAGSAKAKTQAACLTCHEARIIVQQRLNKAAWTKEVDKMVKWGAEVDPNDRDLLIEYLSANFGSDRPAYQAPSSADSSRRKPRKTH